MSNPVVLWQNIRPLMEFLGHITTILFIVGLITALVSWFRGILPPIIRLGFGLRKRKIAIFAINDNFQMLKALLIDSKLFDETNISQIANLSNIGKSESATIYLIYWPDWKSNITKILNKKLDGTGMIIYSPYDYPDKQIPVEIMKNIDQHRNISVTNFRGRLLNDLVSTMITTEYRKK